MRGGGQDGRNPRPEIRDPKEIRIPKTESRTSIRRLESEPDYRVRTLTFGFRPSDFGLPSALGFRISDFPSRYPPKPGICQPHLQGEQAEGGEQGPLVQWPVGGEAPELDLALLKVVNLIIDALQFAAVGGTVELAAREGGHLGE